MVDTSRIILFFFSQSYSFICMLAQSLNLVKLILNRLLLFLFGNSIVLVWKISKRSIIGLRWRCQNSPVTMDTIEWNPCPICVRQIGPQHDWMSKQLFTSTLYYCLYVVLPNVFVSYRKRYCPILTFTEICYSQWRVCLSFHLANSFTFLSSVCLFCERVFSLLFFHSSIYIVIDRNQSDTNML